MTKRISICLSFDFDAISLWVGPRKSRSPNLIARGEFGEIGAQRLVRLLDDEQIPSTWFIPGHTIETYPKICKQVACAGHEIGYHGYCHEAPSTKRDLVQERAILERSIECIDKLCGKTPVGHRLPGGNLGERWVSLLMQHGIGYDSSLAPNDFEPCYFRRGDVPRTDGPYEFGEKIDLVILPFDWNMDDWPYFAHEGHQQGLRSPDEVYGIWAAEFDYLYQKLGTGVYVLTMHPQCIGKGSRMLMLERLIHYMKAHDNVEFKCLATVAAEYRSANRINAI